jgi:tyrosine-protein kinase Etk/Wzc
MNANNDREDRFLLSIADILSLFRKYKLNIFYWALAFGFAASFFALLNPIRYRAEATFREKGVKSTQFSTSSVLQALGGGSLVGGESEAASLMTSRKILKHVIDQLHLQGNLNVLSDIENYPKLIQRNFMLAWAAMFSRSPEPVLKDLSCPLKIENLQYSGEIPLAFLIELQKDGRYEVCALNHSKRSVGWGQLNEPFQFEQLSFVLAPDHESQQPLPQSFSLTVNSLENTVKEIRTLLKVESAKIDKSLLTLKYEHRDRYLTCDVINAVMSCYQSYLKSYHTDMALTQLDYLGQRRDQLTKNLVTLMEKHADYLANDLYNSGFIESDKEIEFLAKNQNEFKRKLLDNELEINRLANINPGNLAYYDRHTSHDGDSSIINSILTEMRNLKQSRDSLEIELQKKAIDQGVDLQSFFEHQLNELREIQQYLAEVREIAQQYDQGKWPDSNSKLLNDSRFLLKGWIDRLQNLRDDPSNQWKEVNDNFKFYLSNLERLFEVHERILQERLIHHQNPSNEYQGISLEVATNLYLDYSKQLIQIEAEIRQNLFFINQIEDPNFEITSLSSGLTDNVSNAMIQKASELVLNLRDENNQSMREQGRIKEQLQLQRTFLIMHLKQMVQLMELHKQLIDEKIFALQNVSLELIHQRISLFEQNLQDYLKTRLFDLQLEKNLIKSHLESIHGEMSLLPQKWVSEKLIVQEVETNQRIVEEIVKLVESKNISHKLEVIQSAPVDLAIPPVHPLIPKVFLWGFIGFMFGGFLGSGVVLGKTLSKGVNVSVENLELIGFHVSGKMVSPLSSRFNKQLQEGNFATLRRLQNYFERSKLAESSSSVENGSKLLLLLEGEGPDYAMDLADLLLKKRRRVLTLDLNFKETENENDILGLCQYLHGEISDPPIQKGIHGDRIAAGGSSPFVLEMLGSPIFQELIEKLKSDYDWILAVSHANPLSAEAESLLSLFHFAAITLKEERMEELNVYNRFLEQSPQNRLTFILDVSDDHGSSR